MSKAPSKNVSTLGSTLGARLVWLRWRYLRWLLAGALLPIALWACTSHPLEKPKPLPEQETDQYFEINPIRDIDMVFVIDNSPSMVEEIANLKANFPTLMAELKKLPGGLPNVHIGIISTDLGAGPVPIQGGCTRVGGDRGILQAKAGCGLDPNSLYIFAENNETKKNYTGRLEDVFGCMAELGVQGCGYEHQLQALRVGLYENATPLNKGFLRPDAYLGIIFLTDEDDCSGAPDSQLFSMDFPGQQASLRCNVYGHLCGGKPPVPMDGWKAPLDSCVPAPAGDPKVNLIPVQEFVDDIRRLKPRPDQQIIVASIHGWPNNTTGAEYRVWKPPMRDFVEIAPACESPNGSAAPAIRMKSFVESFGASGSTYSICERDFRPALKEIGERLAAKLQTPCVAAPVVDTSPAMGVQPDCIVTDRIPDKATGIYKDFPIPQCSGPGAARPCWQLVQDASCPFGKVNIDRGAAMPAPGTQQATKCLTCSNPTDPRCTKI